MKKLKTVKYIKVDFKPPMRKTGFEIHNAGTGSNLYYIHHIMKHQYLHANLELKRIGNDDVNVHNGWTGYFKSKELAEEAVRKYMELHK